MVDDAETMESSPTPTSHPKGLFRVCSRCGATWRTCNCSALRTPKQLKVEDVKPEVLEIDQDGNVHRVDDPTPNLTAELKELLSDLCGRPITDGDVASFRLWAEIEKRVVTATSKAFEKAERLAREGIDEGMSEGWNDACREIAASIARALAKTEEQADGTNTPS